MFDSEFKKEFERNKKMIETQQRWIGFAIIFWIAFLTTALGAAVYFTWRLIGN